MSASVQPILVIAGARLVLESIKTAFRREDSRPLTPALLGQWLRRRGIGWMGERGSWDTDGSGADWADALLAWAAMVWCTAVGSAVAFLGSNHPSMAILAVATAAATPRIAGWVRRRREGRQRALTVAALPLVVEVMAVGLRASGSMDVAIEAGTQVAADPLRAILRRVMRRSRSGEAVASALTAEGRDRGIAELCSIGDLVERASRLGLSLAGPLEALSAELEAAADVARLTRTGRAIPIAALLTSLVIAPASAGAAAALVVGGAMSGGLTW